jgi:hypothetical protein
MSSDAIWVRFDNFSKVVKSIQRASSHPHCMTTNNSNQIPRQAQYLANP